LQIFLDGPALQPYLEDVMKPITSFALLCAFAAVAQGAVTDPVGYITHTIAANGSSADTYISATLVRPTEFAGASTVTPSGGATITFAGGVPVDLDQTYVLEITSGASEGWWSTVVSSTATTIEVNDDFPGGLPSGVTVAVRKHNTLHSFFGNNNPGLIDFNGEDASDEVQILDPVNQSAKSYVWVTAENSGTDDGVWFDVGDSVEANDVVIEPGTAVRITRIGATELEFVSTGTVKTTKTQVDIYPNFNWVGTQLAVGSTLGAMEFATQLNPFDGENTDYDELQFIRSTQIAEPFAAVDDGGLIMFDLGNSADASAEPFAEGTGVVIIRNENPASTITFPGTEVAP
jgi:hypothetical protein